MLDKKVLLSVLKENVGYHEKKSDKDLDSKKGNSGNKNYTKYAEFFDNLRKQKIYVFNYEKNPCEWCAIYAIYAYWVSYGEIAMKMLHLPYKSTAAGAKFFAQYFKDKKAFKKSPEVGDCIFFGNPIHHVGVVTKVTDKMVYTNEGNVNNQVVEKSYKKDNKNIAGYGRPDWNVKTEEKPKDDPKPAPAKPATPSEIKYKVTATHGLRLRKGAGTNYPVITIMPKDSVFVASKAFGEWVYGKAYDKDEKKYIGNGYANTKWLKKM